jgi:CheY-like chemotaxis protein
MHNLVLNAKQAMPDGGIVKVTGRFIDDISEKISTTESGHFIMMSIEDSGTGIPADDLPRIFDPYFTTKTDGHGLGLATTYAIIRKHGGYIEAKSESGKTCFTFFLPAKRSAADTMSAQRHTEKTRGGKILVLEDETSICSFLKRFFDRFGYLGTITTDGNETITAYRTAMENNDPFDCVLLDLTIPGGMGGRIAMNELLKINPSVKGIVCSGYSNDSAMSSYREHGFIGCITKPYHVEELHELLQTVMR